MLMRLLRPFSAVCLAGVFSLTVTLTAAAQTNGPAAQNRQKHLPYRQYKPLGAKEIGILAGETRPILSTEGRSSAANVLCFSQDGGSYRWVYVPATGRAQITNLRVPVAGGGQQVYPALNMASPQTVANWGVKDKFTLVEVEVNRGAGSPVNDSFVATNVRVLDGSKQYPIDVSDAVKHLRVAYSKWVKNQSKQIQSEMSKAQAKALQKRKPTGPRETKELMYVTWLTADSTLQIRFRTTISDGRYYYVEGGAVRPFPLPPRPINPKIPPPPAAGKAPAAQPPAVPPRPGGIAPPPRFKVKAGTTFGVEFGQTYVVNKKGEVIRAERHPFVSFQQTISPPPILDRRRPIDPVRPLPPARPAIKK